MLTSPFARSATPFDRPVPRAGRAITDSEARLGRLAEDVRCAHEAQGTGVSDRDRRAADHGRRALALLRHYVDERRTDDGLPQWLVLNILHTAATELLDAADFA